MELTVTGARGMLGHRVADEAAARGHEVTRTDLPELDLTDESAVQAALGGRRVIHCTAYTDVDGAETDEVAAMRVNADASANVARAARHVVALSTDYVFAGDASRAYVESDPPAPRTAYRTLQAGRRGCGQVRVAGTRGRPDGVALRRGRPELRRHDAAARARARRGPRRGGPDRVPDL